MFHRIVDADPDKDLIVCPGIAVAPVSYLLVQPSQKTDWAVSQSVADGERLGGLLLVVAEVFFREVTYSLKTFLL